MIGLLIAAGLIVAMLAVSIGISRPNWKFHPGGQKGYITDMLTYFFLPVLPMLVVVGGFSLLVVAKPELENDTARFVLLGIAIVGLLVMRRLPLVVAAQTRVRTARNARYEASQR